MFFVFFFLLTHVLLIFVQIFRWESLFFHIVCMIRNTKNDFLIVKHKYHEHFVTCVWIIYFKKNTNVTSHWMFFLVIVLKRPPTSNLRSATVRWNFPTSLAEKCDGRLFFCIIDSANTMQYTPQKTLSIRVVCGVVFSVQLLLMSKQFSIQLLNIEEER